MRVVIDLQGAQRPAAPDRARNDLLDFVRGITGRFPQVEIVVALSGFRPDSVDAVRTALADALPADRIRVWYAERPARGSERSYAQRRELARCLRAAFLRALEPDVLVVTGPYAALSEDVLTLPEPATADLPTAVLLAEDDVPPPESAARAESQRFVQAQREAIDRAEACMQLARSASGTSMRLAVRGPGRTLPAGCEGDWNAIAECALAVFTALARPSHAPADPVRELAERIARLPHGALDARRMEFTARAIAANHPQQRLHHLYVDISGIVDNDLKTGIQRVTRSILGQALQHPPAGYRVVPVYARPGIQGFLQVGTHLSEAGSAPVDEPIDAQPGDVFLALDFVHWVAVAQQRMLEWMRNHGVRVYFVVYDLLPVRFPQYFPSSSPLGHEEWLRIVAGFDGGICISRAVQQDLDEWLDAHGLLRKGRFRSGWFHLGADVEASQPTLGLPADGEDVLRRLAACPTFLMVGTLEPRKGHRQVLAAFDLLWAKGLDVNLAIVGKAGWMMEDFAEAVRRHPELNRRLFWPAGVSDEYLDRIYTASSSLIAASECEGFGLPLIEAARKHLPVIARDIPVFREVAGDHAFYFSGESADELAGAIEHWLGLWRERSHPAPAGMPWLTWEQSARQLLANIC